MGNQFLDIDILNLDKEWIKQPKLYFKWAKKLAKLKKALEVAKVESDLIRADLDKDIRINPNKHNIPESVKITEAVVNSAILQSNEYKVSQEKVINLKYQVDVCTSAVTAVVQRKEALENEVRLHGQSYFSTPKVKEAGKEVVESILEKNRKERRKKGRKNG